MFENLKISTAFKNSITAAVSNGKLSHAMILEGSDESTRLSAAKEIASAVLCQGETKPCGVCNKCKKIANDCHPDVHIIHKDKKSSMIKVDVIRELKSSALVYPNDGEKSIFIINDAEHMNPQAQNALLKIFEEPAKHLIFILCCQTKSSLLDTIISRATLYNLGFASDKMPSDENDTKAQALANELLCCFVQENELSFLKSISVFQKDKDMFRLCLDKMHDILRDAIVFQAGGKDMLSGSPETVKKLSSRLTQKKILQLFKIIDELSQNSLLNANHNLNLTRLSSLFYSLKSR